MSCCLYFGYCPKANEWEGLFHSEIIDFSENSSRHGFSQQLILAPAANLVEKLFKFSTNNPHEVVKRFVKFLDSNHKLSGYAAAFNEKIVVGQPMSRVYSNIGSDEKFLITPDKLEEAVRVINNFGFNTTLEKCKFYHIMD